MRTTKEIREEIRKIRECFPEGDIDQYIDGTVVRTLEWVLEEQEYLPDQYSSGFKHDNTKVYLRYAIGI